MRGHVPDVSGIHPQKQLGCNKEDDSPPLHERIFFPFLVRLREASGMGLLLPPGASPIPAVLLRQHLAFVISCSLDSGKSILPKKVGVLVQFGQSTQSPFHVILGSLPSFFLNCSWAWDGLWIFHVSWSGVGGDLGAGQVTCVCPQPSGPAQNRHFTRASLLIIYSGVWVGCI